MAVPSAVSLSCLALVVAAGVGLVAVSSNATEDPATPPTAAAPTTAPAATITPLPLPLPLPSPDPEPTKPTKPTKPDPKPKLVPVIPQVLVEVYNNSGVSGLAADKATALDDAGWNVAATDNWYGNIPENTVYYPVPLKAQATRLAKTLQVSRVRPAVSPMQFDRLTVIFTTA